MSWFPFRRTADDTVLRPEFPRLAKALSLLI